MFFQMAHRIENLILGDEIRGNGLNRTEGLRNHNRGQTIRLLILVAQFTYNTVLRHPGFSQDLIITQQEDRKPNGKAR